MYAFLPCICYDLGTRQNSVFLDDHFYILNLHLVSSKAILAAILAAVLEIAEKEPEKKLDLNPLRSKALNLLTPMSDQDRISPYNIDTISTRWVTRIKKNINLGIISWSNTTFSELTL